MISVTDLKMQKVDLAGAPGLQDTKPPPCTSSLPFIPAIEQPVTGMWWCDIILHNLGGLSWWFIVIVTQSQRD